MLKSKVLKLLLIIVGMAGLSTASFLAGRNSTPWRSSADEVDLEHNEVGAKYSFIDPLLGCEALIPTNYQKIQKAEAAVNAVVEWATSHGQINSASVYFRDLNNGPWFGIKEKDPFIPASLLKVPLAITYLERAQTEPSILEREINYRSEAFHVRQNLVYSEPLEEGRSYSVKELIERMMTTSDNTAMTLLTEEDGDLTLDAMGRVYKDLGMTSPTDVGNYEINAVTYSRFFRVLYNATYLSRSMSEYALELLSRGSFADGLAAGIPKGVMVAHKFGERTHPATGERQLHDCGIVYAPTRPYLLCVMTRGKEFKQLASVIADISREVYREMELTLTNEIDD